MTDHGEPTIIGRILDLEAEFMRIARDRHVHAPESERADGVRSRHVTLPSCAPGQCRSSEGNLTCRDMTASPSDARNAAPKVHGSTKPDDESWERKAR